MKGTGGRVTSVGDLNGDGQPELLVAANQAAAGAVRPGAAYVVDLDHLGDTYCLTPVANSTGQAAQLVVTGSPVAADENVTLTAGQLPPNQFGYFLLGGTQVLQPSAGGSVGTLCLGAPLGRFVSQVGNSGAQGMLSIQVDTTLVPTTPPQSIAAGQTWNFQLWYRDSLLGIPTSNFSDAVAIEFQ